MKKFPFFKQLDYMDCGPTCLKMIAHYYGKRYSLEELRKVSYYSRNGTTLLGLSQAAENIGFKTISAQMPIGTLLKAPLPLIVFWRQRHYVIVYKCKNNVIFVADPAFGLIEYKLKDFNDGWLGKLDHSSKGIALLLEPTPKFYNSKVEQAPKANFGFLFQYFKLYRRYIFQLFLGLTLGSLIQLAFPFLTQSIIDIGIQQNNLSFINIILIGQLVLFISQTITEIIRNWLLLHISSRINISIVSDFLAKIMALPISFFESKTTGDLMQRVSDHKRVEVFLTTSILSVIFSIVSLIIFGLVLLYYNLSIFTVFIIGSTLQTIWVMFFLNKREKLDYTLFEQSSSDQSNLIELFSSMSEVKIYNSERSKRWRWERVQATLFRVKLKTLELVQLQDIGSNSINQIKNILITFISAKAVLSGDVTLGVMLSVQYIIGQMQSPVKDLTSFIKSWQDAKISLERMNEIHNINNEAGLDDGLSMIPDEDIKLSDLSFKYSPHSNFSLSNVNLVIPRGKVVAIVGGSGSGKTTLIKLLLKLYTPVDGQIEVGGINLNNLNNRAWREKCSAVLQTGYIFNDTIAQNIALDEDSIDIERLMKSLDIANLLEYVNTLPMGINTKLAGDGYGLSSGQRQRLLIARAVYKRPEILFFDEATNALDADNERKIINNLNAFFEGRTVVIVAHRLSTVREADKIIVLEKGRIVEEGPHRELIEMKGVYYNLIKNQLELGT